MRGQRQARKSPMDFPDIFPAPGFRYRDAMGETIMGELSFLYRFRLADGRRQDIELRVDTATLEPRPNPAAERPDWTRLDFHQCANCPLAPREFPHCPLALQLSQLMPLCEGLLSHDEVDVEAVTAERTVVKHTTAQRALSSLMGLIIATSGCPHTVFLKPMARFHLPLSSEEETVYRASSMYLLAQYFRNKQGEPADFELLGLKRTYDALHQINLAMASRLRAVSSKDSAVNAVVMLDLFTKAMPYSIEESLEEIRYLFLPYLRQ
jgi:hypothetical protein